MLRTSIPSTDYYNELLNQARCAKLGVDEFEVDWKLTYSRKPAKICEDVSTPRLFGPERKRRRDYYEPVVRWRIGDNWFYGAVPVKIEYKRESTIFIEEYVSDYAWNKMELELEIMINESKEMV